MLEEETSLEASEELNDSSSLETDISSDEESDDNSLSEEECSSALEEDASLADEDCSDEDTTEEDEVSEEKLEDDCSEALEAAEELDDDACGAAQDVKANKDRKRKTRFISSPLRSNIITRCKITRFVFLAALENLTKRTRFLRGFYSNC